MKSKLLSHKAHGNKNRFDEKLTIGDMVNLDTLMHRRGHMRKVLHITIEVNRNELEPLMEVSYKDKPFDRIKELRDSCTYIDKVLKADNQFGIL